MKEIVVGVDGSDGSRNALGWAVEEARAHGAALVVVHAWTYPVAVGPMTTLVVPDLDFESRGHKLLDQMIGAVDTRGVTVEKRLIERGATEALLRASRDADLLVIGSRGFGGFRGLLLGSVGHQCAQHASCPVVVIPHGEQAETT